MRFRFGSEEITKGKRCNCSICSRKSALMSVRYYPPEEFELLSGKDSLTLYTWGDRMVHHWFCKVCGIYPFHDGTEKPWHHRVNLGCVDGLEPLSLEVEYVDGRSF